MSSDHRQVRIEDDDRLVAAADVRIDPDEGVVHADLHVEAGHQRPGARSELVDAVLDQVNDASVQRVQATVPAGDAEMLQRLRDRCHDVETRPAGSTILVDGELTDQ